MIAMKRYMAVVSVCLAMVLGSVATPEVEILAGATATASTAAQTNKSKSASKKKSRTTTGKSGRKNNGQAASRNRKNTRSAQKSGKQTSKPRTAAEVKRAKEKNTREMRETKRKITLNTRETEQRLNQLNLLEGELANCNVNIGRLSGRVDSINGAIRVANDSISSLDARLAAITDKYVKAVRRTQGTRKHMSQMAFIFSSDSFSQAYRRMRALRQFSKWRKRRSAEISDMRKELDGRRAELETLKKSAAAALGSLNNERSVLQRKQAETGRLVDRLKSEGAELNAIMDRRRREAQSLDAELDRIVAEEVARQERLRREQEEAERRARAEAERKAREQEEARRQAEAEAAAEAEAVRKAEAEAAAAKEAARKARAAKEAEEKARKEAQAAEEQARKQADKESKRKAKEAAAAAKKAEKERVAAEREAARRQAEADKKLAQQRARGGKPVKHTGKNNLGKVSGSESGAPAPKLSTPAVSGAASGVAPKMDANIGGDFADYKGRLPFPVAGRYTIVKRFGRQKHPTLPHVETTNSGIDMQTEPGTGVRAVFDGEVSAVFRPDGYNNVVVIRHGKFMTVYANLGAISVSTGQKVKAGQSIGTVFTDANDSNRSVLHFEIRNQRQKENPELWLRR